MTATTKDNPATRENIETAGTSSATTLPRLVRAKVIAAALDVSPRCVFLWATEGKIPSVRIGGTVRFDPAAVLATLERKGGAN